MAPVPLPLERRQESNRDRFAERFWRGLLPARRWGSRSFTGPARRTGWLSDIPRARLVPGSAAHMAAAFALTLPSPRQLREPAPVLRSRVVGWCA